MVHSRWTAAYARNKLEHTHTHTHTRYISLCISLSHTHTATATQPTQISNKCTHSLRVDREELQRDERDRLREYERERERERESVLRDESK